MLWNVACLTSFFWSSPIDESALKKSLNSLESCWKSLDHSLDKWEFAVAVGVAVELVVIVAEYWHERSDFERGIIHPPEKPSRWAFFFGFVGTGLVVVGLAQEIRVHSKLGLVETEMRGISSQLVALVDARAADAENKAEDERLARVQLEKSMQPRSLSNDQKTSICRALGPENAVNVLVEFPTADMQEAYTYAEDFTAAINACVKNRNWTMGPLGAGPTEPIKRGLWLKFDSGVPETRRLALLLENVLGSAGVPVNGTSPGTAKPGTVTILVGFKPQPTSQPPDKIKALLK